MIRGRVRRLLALGALAIVATSAFPGWAAVNTVPESNADEQVFGVEIDTGVPAECSHLSIQNTIYHPAPATGQSDLIFGTAGSDNINGSGGNDCIVGLGGDDTLDGSGGSDVLIGGPENDWLLGGGGADRLYGNEGIDILSAGGGSDFCDGGPNLDLGLSCEVSVNIP